VVDHAVSAIAHAACVFSVDEGAGGAFMEKRRRFAPKVIKSPSDNPAVSISFPLTRHARAWRVEDARNRAGYPRIHLRL
jgi:hypothetical protein